MSQFFELNTIFNPLISCRFNNFLYSKMLTVLSRSKHTLAGKLLKDIDAYGCASVKDRSKFFNKVTDFFFKLEIS